MSLYESFLLLNIFPMLLHSSSGAGDCMWVYWCIGWVRLEWGGIQMQVEPLQHCSNLHSDTTLLQPNSTNTPVHTETEQYAYIQSLAPEDECNNIRYILSNKKLS